MLVRKFFAAVARDWASLVTGTASIPLTLLAFWARTPTQRAMWAVVALLSFVVAAFRVWANEYRRAEAAEARLANERPRVVVDGYVAVSEQDDETGEDYLVESLHIVNRGGAPAVSIAIPQIDLFGRRARLLGGIRTLGPGEETDVRVLNLRHLLEGVQKKVGPPPKGQAWSVRIPLSVDYRDLNHERWITDHVVIFSVHGIQIDIVHPDEPQQFTVLPVEGGEERVVTL